MKLRVAFFYHSLISDWNHGNAHFLRGIASELIADGHEVLIYEPEQSWSRANLLAEAGAQAVLDFQLAFPHLKSHIYRDTSELEALLQGVDLALVHEWNESDVVAEIGRQRKQRPTLRVFFHDTHHRAITAQAEMARFDLTHYDGVLAYGASLQKAYENLGWGKQVFIWHEAADTRTFYPRECNEHTGDLVWIGNWGDDERTAELREYLIDPVRQLSLQASVHGVRYPDTAVQELGEAGIRYLGWLPNFEVPATFAKFTVTVHVPRRPYTEQLAGIPTIRPFESLACGIPLVSAPWRDEENLFRVGEDFLMVHSGGEMRTALKKVMADQDLRDSLIASGLETIHGRHTCKHRVRQLLEIYGSLAPAIQREEEVHA